MIRVGSNFTGIGAWEKALSNLGIDFELKFFSEIDKYAVTAYGAIHNVDEKLNIGDITKVVGDEVEDIDLFVYSPPCQAFSVAGKQGGFDDRRGILFFDSLRIIDKKRPHICLMENVKGLTSKKFQNEFNTMLQALENLGYKNYWKVLNLKDYGLPQNRERVFIVSIREDIDDGKFEFPEGYDNGLRLKDMLEHEVEEKFYISQDKVLKILNWKAHQRPFKNVLGQNSTSPTLTARGAGEYHSGMVLLSKELEHTTNIDEKLNREYSHSICASIGRTTEREYFKKNQGQMIVEPSILRYERTEYGKEIRKYYEAGLIEEHIGNMRKPTPRTDGICNTLSTVQKDNMLAVPCLTPDRSEKRQNGRRFKEDGEPMFTLTAQDKHGILEIGKLEGKNYNQNKVVYATNGLSPTIHGQGHCGNEPKIIQAVGDRGSHTYSIKEHAFTIPNNPMSDRGQMVLESTVCEQRADEGLRFFKDENVGALRTIDSCGDKRVLEKIGFINESDSQANRVYSIDGLASAQCGEAGGLGGRTGLYLENYRIRKLTPKECWRLMGFKDEDFEKAKDALNQKFYQGKDKSNSQMYKMAGNSIGVTKLEAIFKQLLTYFDKINKNIK